MISFSFWYSSSNHRIGRSGSLCQHSWKGQEFCCWSSKRPYTEQAGGGGWLCRLPSARPCRVPLWGGYTAATCCTHKQSHDLPEKYEQRGHMSLPSQHCANMWLTRFSPSSITATGEVPNKDCLIHLRHGIQMTQGRATTGPQEMQSRSKKQTFQRSLRPGVTG